MMNSQTIFYNDLYQSVIKKNAAKYDCLRVITGYSSASFVEKVLTDFPNLDLTIYIGMARQGIAKEDHNLYCQLVNEGKAKIYYHVQSPDTHQKILEFCSEKNNHVSFVGSANFSENGFGQQREAMATVEDDLSPIFVNEASMCLPCIDPKVSELIPLSDDEPEKCGNAGDKALRDDDAANTGPAFENSDYFISENDAVQYGFEALLIPDRYDQKNSGINAKPSFIYLNGLSGEALQKKPAFSLIIAGKEYKAYCDGFLGQNVKLKDGDIGAEIRRMLNIPEKQEVNLDYLDKIRCTRALLSPYGLNQYMLELIKNKDK